MQNPVFYAIWEATYYDAAGRVKRKRYENGENRKPKTGSDHAKILKFQENNAENGALGPLKGRFRRPKSPSFDVLLRKVAERRPRLFRSLAIERCRGPRHSGANEGCFGKPVVEMVRK